MTEINNKPIVSIKEWYFNQWNNALFGNVYGHEKFEDGTDITTSGIVNVSKDLIGECFIVETRNTMYTCLFKDIHHALSKYPIDEIWEQLQNMQQMFKAKESGHY